MIIIKEISPQMKNWYMAPPTPVFVLIPGVSYCEPCLEVFRKDKPAPELLWHLSWGCWWWREAEILTWNWWKGKKFKRDLKVKKIIIVYPLEEREEGISEIANGTNFPLVPGEAGSSYISGCYGFVVFFCCTMNFLSCAFSFLLGFILWHPVSSSSSFGIISPMTPGDLLLFSIIESSHSCEVWPLWSWPSLVIKMSPSSLIASFNI